jgi:hypothetical protein
LRIRRLFAADVFLSNGTFKLSVLEINSPKRKDLSLWIFDSGVVMTAAKGIFPLQAPFSSLVGSGVSPTDADGTAAPPKTMDDTCFDIPSMVTANAVVASLYFGAFMGSWIMSYLDGRLCVGIKEGCSQSS